jgi:Outer membrane protein beta-barrel domain
VTRFSRVTVCVTVALSLARMAGAETQTVSLVAPDMARWDASGSAGWFGRSERSPEAVRSETWVNAGSFAASLGYHWTPHLKFEAEAATSSTASFYTFESLTTPDRSSPTFRSREHAVKTTSATGRVVYQFFENRWVHPFVTAGVEVSRDRDRIETLIPPVAPSGPFSQPVTELETRSTTSARPVFGGGFKFYVAERAFIRTDTRFSFGRDGVANSSWGAGIGFDF